MQYTIIALDGTDEDAPARRQAVRQQHIALGDELVQNGNLWYGAALLNEDDSMKGSMYVLNFKTEADFEAYKKREPYISGDVWRDISIHRSNTRNPWQFNHDKDWFIAHGANSD